MGITLLLSTGQEIPGAGPVVVVGPNGSGKTRHARTLVAAAGTRVEFVNALRNTRVASELPAMGQDSARANFEQQKAQAHSSHWEITSEFDYMLSQLLAQSATAALDFARRYREDRTTAGDPAVTPLSRVEDLWKEVFPGRTLRWDDWKPIVTSHTSGSQTEYSGHFMSDGEKAALFLASRVFSADPGLVLVVDEPETHFHSLLAVRLWNALEDARPDLRFVYITHDLTFAMSRRDPRYVLASPTEGLKLMDLGGELPPDVGEALLGSASLSFYARRVIFCEGEHASYDSRVYNAWFSGLDTVVRAVGSSERVIRCVDAMRQAGLTQSLDATGIVDRDYYSEKCFDALPAGVRPLPVHEVESLFVLPSVVAAVAVHLAKEYDADDYLDALRKAVSEDQRHQLVIQRWKSRIEPYLARLVATTSKRDGSLDDLASALPSIFSMGAWDFSPQSLLEEEKRRVEDGLTSGDAMTLLALAPGKPLLPVASRMLGMEKNAYVDLVVNTLRQPDAKASDLRSALITALEPHLPARAVPAAASSAALPLTPE